MKKFLTAAILAVALVFIGTAAEASQVTITQIDKKPVYLETETVKISQRDPLEFVCTVVFEGAEFEYEFFSKDGTVFYSVDNGVEYRLKNYPYSIPDYAYKYVVSHF